eukprot:COSAG01_NODE_14506_length_1445_cov_2.125557_2_plen_145_part_00
MQNLHGVDDGVAHGVAHCRTVVESLPDVTGDAAGAASGRTGIFVEFEGWLEKQTAGSRLFGQRWEKLWFAVMTRETNGLVDARSMQYFSSFPTLGQEPEHSLPLSGTSEWTRRACGARTDSDHSERTLSQLGENWNNTHLWNSV